MLFTRFIQSVRSVAVIAVQNEVIGLGWRERFIFGEWEKVEKRARNGNIFFFFGGGRKRKPREDASPTPTVK